MNRKTNDKNLLFDILNNKIFTSEFISGIAGDRSLRNEEKILYEKLLKETGDDLYVKLLFYITHKVFDADRARLLWDSILEHKNNLSKILKRNVAISVATLDYLTNIEDELKNPKLIGEAFVGKIAEMTSVDSLTKLYNRQYLLIKINQELNRFKRHNTTFSLLMIDLDDFKNINDKHGHQKGDDILIRIAALFENTKRELDICSRYGGEEFVFVLPHTKINEAKKFAERIRISVQKTFEKNTSLTVSIGISNCPKSGITAKKLIKTADEALYESKRKGKNAITFK